MPRRAQYKPFEVIKHKKVMWRVKFPKGDLDADKPVRKDFSTHKDANKFVREFLNKRNKLGELGNALLPENAADAVKALRILPPGISLEEAAAFTSQRMAEAESSCTFYDGYTDFLKWCGQNHRSKRHIRNLKQTFKAFKSLWTKNLTAVLRLEIEEVLAIFPTSSSNLKLRHLSAFLNHCIRKDWLQESPIRKIQKRKEKEKDGPIEIFTIESVRSFLFTVASQCPEAVPYFAIAFFGGTRPEEILKLTWQNIGDTEIMIPPAVNKTRTERYTKINTTLRAWLDWHRDSGGLCTGPIYPRSEKTLERKRRALAQDSGIKWIQDGPRHTFASAHYKTYSSEENTVRELGHKGSKMLHRHYNRNMKADDAEAYWAILPPQT